MLVSLASAKGAPGVTTSAHVLAGVWPRSVILAELDPAGSDLLYRASGQDGRPLDPERGLVSLAAAQRRDPTADLHDHLSVIDGGLQVLVGLARPEQASAIGAGWATLAAGLRRYPDVIADVGRVAPGSPSLSVVLASDLTLIVTRPGVEYYGHLRDRLEWLRAETAHRASPVRLAVLLVAPWRSRHEADDLSQLLRSKGIDVPVAGVLATDPGAADTLAGRRPRPLGRTLLVRSAHALADSLSQVDVHQPSEEVRP